ncbi:MAG: hypothetical protein AB1767_13330 [Bacillota bacterium]
MKLFAVWRLYRQSILPMSAFVAWLWAFPLFGELQDLLPARDNWLLVLNLSFLLGNSLGYLGCLLLTQYKLKTLAPYGPPANLLLATLLILLSWAIPVTEGAAFSGSALIVYSFLPALMGASISPFFACWGSTLTSIKRDCLGRYMALMMFAASFFSAVIFIISRLSAITALLAAFCLLVLAAFYARNFLALVPDNAAKTVAAVNATKNLPVSNTPFPGKSTR